MHKIFEKMKGLIMLRRRQALKYIPKQKAMKYLIYILGLSINCIVKHIW